jgi:hypothetical protein
MARTIDQRLGALKARRTGSDGTEGMAIADSAGQSALLARSLLGENYQKRAANEPNTRYALGAMQEVGDDYTRISIETATRVGNQLKNGLTAAGFSVDFRLQGSVPLNVHIRGVSDVDLLNFDIDYLTYRVHGPQAVAGHYGPSSGRTSLEVLTRLRATAELILTQKYPAATVDVTGGKAIKISGGSLARAVDVVPAHWDDTIEYQRSKQECDRGVTILDKWTRKTLDNLPFLHIKRVGERDAEALGGLRKAIRLCKNVKADAEEDGKAIALPSFDIAATMYHADLNALRSGYVYELSVLAEAQRYLDWLYKNEPEARKLLVPDGSRPIFDSAEKISGLLSLSVEMDHLLKEVAREQSTRRGIPAGVNLPQNRAILAESYVADA